MSAQHTPGPWHPRRRFPYVVDARGRFVADCNKEDARLIAAAPDLLDALQDALQYLQHHLPDEALASHRAAIVKATGAAS